MWKKSEEENVASANTGSAPKGGNSRKSVSTVGGGSVVVGEIKGEEDLVIMGLVDGVVTLSQNTVSVGRTGKVKGTINSKAILVEGIVEGDLHAADKIILKASAKVKGNISAGRLVMEDGCYFQGGIDMIETAKAAPKSVEKPREPNSVKPVPSKVSK